MSGKSRTATNSDLSEIKKLWKEAFLDTDSFIEWNFKYNYQEDNTFIQEYDGEIASVVQIIPHTLIAVKERLSAAYIWGMLTKKKHQGKGFARKSFNYVLPEIYSRGYDISILTSAVGDMYEKFGYTTVCNSESYKEPEEYDVDFLDDINDSIEHLDEIYKRYVSDKKLYMERPYEYWKRIVGDIDEGSKGHMAVVNKGYALLYPHNDGYTAGELIGEEKAQVINSMPVMVRVINAKGLAKKLAKYIKEDIVISIKDDFIKENNTTIAFKDGEVAACDGRGIPMNINEFGAMLFNACGTGDDVYIKFPL